MYSFPGKCCGRSLCHLLLVLCFFMGISAAQAKNPVKIELSKLFANNMVLQRDKPCPVWGKTAPKTDVTVSLGKIKVTVKSDDKGNFLAVLPPQPAGGPVKLTLKTSHGKREFSNILLGDVWLCGGQDNMRMSVKNSMNSAKEIASANHPTIRLFNVNNYPDALARENKAELLGNWNTCTPQTIPFFSAVAYFFGRTLNQKIRVPIGLIETSWSDSPIKSWISYGTLKNDPQLVRYANRLDQALEEQTRKKVKGLWEKTVARESFNETNKVWAGLDYDDGKWGTIQLPRTWEGFEQIGPIDGAVWFRKIIEVSKEDAGKDATLFLGAIDDFDITWVNGEKVGFTGQKTPNFWQHPREYTIPGKLLKAGRNIIAVRVFDHYGGGGFHGTPDQMYLKTASTRIPLKGNWKFKVGFIIPNEARNNQTDQTKSPWTATSLYNTRIAPLAPFAFKGILWYQGESDTGSAAHYDKQFEALIRSWRELLGKDLPFIYVQLPGYQDKEYNDWPQIRQAQSKALAIPGTAMAVTIDLGNAKDIHPQNKQEVGKRLALAAMHTAYGKKIPYCGPTLKEIKKEKDSSLRLTFNDTYGSLKIKGKELNGFTIAGEDGKRFFPAQASINGQSVIVHSDKVKEPVWVRYAWENFPKATPLYNKADLPAVPFSASLILPENE